MAQTDINISLKVDFGDDASADEKLQIMRVAVRTAAKHLFTQATLISTRSRPQVAIHSMDFFEGEQEISLADDIPE